MPPRTGWRRTAGRVPLLAVTAGIGTLLMLVVALFAGASGDDDSGRAFLYGGVLFTGLVGCAGVSAATMTPGNPARAMLLSLAGIYLLVPVLLALPLQAAMPGLSFRHAYFEMVSSLTTTGATVFAEPGTVPDAVHLWRALVGWYGGFLIWVAAIAILAPLRLGGFEVMLEGRRPGPGGTAGPAGFSEPPMPRIARFARQLAPVYGGLTLGCWLCLLIAGETPLVAACHALSTLSSSGITPLADLSGARAGRWGEVVLFGFMVFALSRLTFARDMPVPPERRWWQDPELRLAAVLMAATTALVFLHHFLAGTEAGVPIGLPDSLRSLWGALFMAMSFLTTTGFVSADWDMAQHWSELTTPGLVLMGLAMVGGGVATTAGGVKLLRVYVLYKHGRFEAERLLQPSLVASPGSRARRFGQEQAFVAWLYFMIFALSLTAVMLALSLLDVGFESALLLATASLTTTGQLAGVGGDASVAWGSLPAGPQLVLCLAMVLGRVETLAFVALLNPAFWRR